MSEKEYEEIDTESLVKLIIEKVNTESDILTIEEFNLYIKNSKDDKKITDKIKEIKFYFDDLLFTNGKTNNLTYHRILSRLKYIEFKDCKFEDNWKHIDCPITVYTDCTWRGNLISDIEIK